MVQFIPPPDPHGLLPPLIACLPTAFVSPRPPPALLPLLSPILCQRVQLLTADGTLYSDSWLPLLCWDAGRASKLAGIVEHMSLEPHPVSGEIELNDIERIRYRRLDEETLHSRLDVEDVGLTTIYLWCRGDDSGNGNGWRLAELVALRDVEEGPPWFSSMTEADEYAKSGELWRSSRSRNGGTDYLGGTGVSTNDSMKHDHEEEDEDDDYWASYDRTPGRTPARTPASKHSPAPIQNMTAFRDRSTSELEYFARYANEVQPALDCDDPSNAEQPKAGGLAITAEDEDTVVEMSQPSADAADVRNGRVAEDSWRSRASANPELNHPRPSSASSSGRASVERLEQTAVEQTRAEVGIRQHVSTEIKGLFRLAQSAGIDREEFESMVRTELELLCLMESDI